MKKALIFAPFWGQVGHVGSNRVERMIRWLRKDGYAVAVVRGGSADSVREAGWGTEITVRDPLGLYRDGSSGGLPMPKRRPNAVRRAIASRLFVPDPTIMWARAASSHPAVLRWGRDAAFVLSSSPPESVHVGARRLARALRIAHVVDMRDGWLDEPLKPVLQSPGIRRWREQRLEARILRDAAAIMVTSNSWKQLLCGRLPGIADKVAVVTNAYPAIAPEPVGPCEPHFSARDVLIHAGRFLGSQLSRHPEMLFEPLLGAARRQASRRTIKLVGELGAEELAEVDRFRDQFSEHGWTIEVAGSMPRGELLKELPAARGLLLLSASRAAIPSKLFEYVAAGRPILVVTSNGSATWLACESLRQAFLVDATQNDHVSRVDAFLQACDDTNPRHDMPHEFSEDYVSHEMRAVLENIAV